MPAIPSDELSQALVELRTALDSDAAVDTAHVSTAALSATLEELSAALEELRAQNEELAGLHQAIGRERGRYEELFRLAPEGYLVTDLHGVVREANARALAMLQRSERELLGKPLAACVAQGSRSAFRRRITQARNGVRSRGIEIDLSARDGEDHIAIATVERADGADGVAELRWVLVDEVDTIRARRALAQALLSSPAEEPGPSIPVVDVPRSDDVLHTHPTAVRSAIRTLLRHAEDQTSDELLDGLRDQVDDVLSLIPGLVRDLRSPGSVNVDLVGDETQVIDVGGIVNEVVAQHRTETPAQEHRDVVRALDVELVTGRRRPLRLILAGLLRNAIGRAPEGTSVVVRTRLAAEGGLEVQVDDQGPAPALPTDQPVRQPPADERPGQEAVVHEVTRIELPIVIALVEAVGGRLWVSRSDDGATGYSVRIPDATPLSALAD